MSLVVILPVLVMLLYRVGVPALRFLSTTPEEHNPANIWCYYD